jgi:hypothetical protein
LLYRLIKSNGTLTESLSDKRGLPEVKDRL